MDGELSHGKANYPSVSVVDNLTSDIFKAVVLFTWDNILGPKTLHIWTGYSDFPPPGGADVAGSSLYTNPSVLSSPPQYSFIDDGFGSKKLSVSSNNVLDQLKEGLLKSGSDASETFVDIDFPNDCIDPEGIVSAEDSAINVGERSSNGSCSSGCAENAGLFITPDLLSFSARLILNGEICKDWNSGNVDRKIVNLPDRDVVICAYTFAVGTESGLSIHSLALFIPSDEMQSFLSIQRLVSSWMERLSRKLGVLLEKTPSSIATDAFTPYLEDFALMLSSLQEAGLPAEINLSDTLFSNCDKLIQETDYFKFLRRAISSHIMTCGRSLIIGVNPCLMNKLIATLAMFNTKHERRSSRFVVKDRQWPYHHDLCLQGLLKENSHEVNIPTEEIYCSEFPTTVVDTCTLEVRQSLPSHEHNFRRYEICKQEIIKLYTGKSQGFKLRTSEMFSASNDQEELVEKLLNEICCLPSDGNIVQAYIDHFMLLLKRKAVTFATYIEKETNEGRNPLKASLKSIREHFGLNLDGDFNMVLACAEKLNFGMFAYLFGDPKEKNDEMRRIIDSF